MPKAKPLVREVMKKANAGGKAKLAVLKTAVSNFRPGPATGHYKTSTVGEAVRDFDKNVDKILSAIKSGSSRKK